MIRPGGDRTDTPDRGTQNDASRRTRKSLGVSFRVEADGCQQTPPSVVAATGQSVAMTGQFQVATNRYQPHINRT